MYGAGFDGTTPAGANWSPGAPPIIMPPPANQGGVYQSPFNNTPIAGSQSFFAVGPQTSPVTLGWGGDDQTSFTMLWGSIDSYNLIEFLHESGNPANDTTLTGAGLVALFPGELTGTGPNYEQVALLQFVFNDGAPGSDIDAIRFSSSQAAFEFGLQAIPVPASLMLFLSALAGLCALTLRRGG